MEKSIDRNKRYVLRVSKTDQDKDEERRIDRERKLTQRENKTNDEMKEERKRDNQRKMNERNALSSDKSGADYEYAKISEKEKKKKT
jgi:hypothetical protein